MGFSSMPTLGRTSSVVKSLRVFAADIKVAHSVFALPFAASALILGHMPWPTVQQVSLLLVCMVSARSVAMGMNRFLDRHIDRANPRTRGRKIPSGELSPQAGLTWSLAFAVLFVAASSQLSNLAGWCSVPLLVVLSAYSFMKHISWMTHWYLGLCLGLAPVAVQLALTGGLTLPVLLVGLGVVFWTGGFDILYSLQDFEFDRKVGLKSVPGRFGPNKALWLSRVSFFLVIAFLSVAGVLAGRGWIYQGGVALVAILLTFEHWLIRDARHTGASQHLGVAFFNVNAWVSVSYLGFTLVDRWVLAS